MRDSFHVPLDPPATLCDQRQYVLLYRYGTQTSIQGRHEIGKGVVLITSALKAIPTPMVAASWLILTDPLLTYSLDDGVFLGRWRENIEIGMTHFFRRRVKLVRASPDPERCSEVQ